MSYIKSFYIIAHLRNTYSKLKIFQSRSCLSNAFLKYSCNHKFATKSRMVSLNQFISTVNYKINFCSKKRRNYLHHPQQVLFLKLDHLAHLLNVSGQRAMKLDLNHCYTTTMMICLLAANNENFTASWPQTNFYCTFPNIFGSCTSPHKYSKAHLQPTPNFECINNCQNSLLYFLASNIPSCLSKFCISSRFTSLIA